MDTVHPLVVTLDPAQLTISGELLNDLGQLAPAGADQSQFIEQLLGEVITGAVQRVGAALIAPLAALGLTPETPGLSVEFDVSAVGGFSGQNPDDPAGDLAPAPAPTAGLPTADPSQPAPRVGAPGIPETTGDVEPPNVPAPADPGTTGTPDPATDPGTTSAPTDPAAVPDAPTEPAPADPGTSAVTG